MFAFLSIVRGRNRLNMREVNGPNRHRWIDDYGSRWEYLMAVPMTSPHPVSWIDAKNIMRQNTLLSMGSTMCSNFG